MRAKKHTLADVLFGQGRGAILALLYGHPDQSFYYRQIVRQLAPLSPGTVQRELDVLSRVGLLKRTTTGNQVFYSANTAHPVHSELSTLVNKTFGTFHILTTALKSIEDDVNVAFVYGSIARGEEKAESDVDLIVVGSVSLEDVLAVLGNAERAIAREINPTVYSRAEFRKKVAEKNHFVMSVLRSKRVFLIGDEDELRKVGGVRLVKTGTDER